MSRCRKFWKGFIDQVEEAAQAGLSPREFAALHGMPFGTVTSRLHTLRKRGIRTTPLRGQRNEPGPGRGPYRQAKAVRPAPVSVPPGPKVVEGSVIIYVM